MPDYRSDAGLLEHLLKQKLNIEQFKIEAGADAEDVKVIVQDHDNMKAIVDFCPLADEYKTNSVGIKRVLVRGNIGEPVGNLMTAPVFTPPFAMVAGIEKRSRERDGRFKRSKTITTAALLALDLTEETTDSLRPETVKPTVEGFAAQTGYEAAVIIGNRGKSDMWKILGRKINSEKWIELTSGTGKAGNLKITPNNDGQPERMEVVVRLYRGNEPYGQQSEPTYITFNP